MATWVKICHIATAASIVSVANKKTKQECEEKATDFHVELRRE